MVITFKTKVSSKYFAMRGIVEEVGGRIFDTSRRNTTMDSSTEMVRVIFSPESVGRKNTAIERNAISAAGSINTTVKNSVFLLILSWNSIRDRFFTNDA